MITRLRALWADRKVLGILVKRDLRVRYSQSFLGYLWTIIDPLANALIYFMLFAVIFHRSDAGHSPYFLFLIVALLSWQWFNAAVAESPRALIAEQKLVRSTKLPRELWVIRMVTAKGIEFLLSLPVLIIFFTIYFIRGEARFTLKLTERTAPGRVVTEGIWWREHTRAGNVNLLTAQRLTDKEGGSTFYDVCVDVRAAE